MRRLVALEHAYTVRHTRRNAGGETGGGWHTTVKRADGAWSDNFDTRTRWGGARKAARLAFESERGHVRRFDPEAPYTLQGEIEV